MEKLENGGYPNDVATPKNEFTKELFADMMTYYVRNFNSLSHDEREDFARLDNATNAQQLVNWAENFHITGSMGDMTGIELANIIRNVDEKTLSNLLQDTQQHPRIIHEKMAAIFVQASKTKNELPESPVILFRNGDGNFTALGEDAKKTADRLAVMPDNSFNDIPIVNVNSSGIAILEHNLIPYHIAEPVTNISFTNMKDNDLVEENRLLMQMGHLAMLSKGDTVRYNTDGKIFGNEKTIELRGGLYSATFINENDRMELIAVPIQLFNTKDGLNESYLSNLNTDGLQKLRNFFKDNFDRLKKDTIDYAFTRKALDENLKTLIGQNDHLKKDNPDTIILIKQRGFVEAFSDSAINVANTLGLSLYNRSDHKGNITIPFTRMTIDDYKKLYETDNNVYLAMPLAQDKMTDANLTKVNPNNMPLAQQENQEMKKSERHTIKR